MSIVGKVHGLWRYPVKSLRGEELEEAFVGAAGLRGDRIYAFKSSACPASFPYFTAREQRQMLRYRPRFRRSAAGAPNHLVEVEMPSGEVLAIDDPQLLRKLREGIGGAHELTLVRSEGALADCHPVSIFSLQTARQLGEELGVTVDPRRFRANVYIDLAAGGGRVENDFVGRKLRLGAQVVISIVERDARCAMITLHPDTGESSPEILRQVAQAHGGTAGVYGAVLATGTVRRGDAVEVVD